MKELSYWSHHAFYLNNLLDDGEKLDLDRTIGAVESHSVYQLLDKEFGEKMDLSIIGENVDDYNQWLRRAWESMATKNRLRRKTGVENNGVSMILALTIEILQHYDDYAQESNYPDYEPET